MTAHLPKTKQFISRCSNNILNNNRKQNSRAIEKSSSRRVQMAIDSVKLLTSWFSPYGMRAVIALHEKGINYEHDEQNLASKSPLLLQMNPVHKKVPVLIHNGKPVTESLIILQYIDETWTSAPPFLPSNPYDRAVTLFWADFLEKKVWFPASQIITTKGEEQEAVKREFVENLTIFGGELKEKDYFGGDAFGLVDIAFVPLFSWFPAIEKLGRFSIQFEEKYPNIEAWKKRCLERESVKKALPPYENVLDYATQLRNHLLGEEA